MVGHTRILIRASAAYPGNFTKILLYSCQVIGLGGQNSWYINKCRTHLHIELISFAEMHEQFHKSNQNVCEVTALEYVFDIELDCSLLG